MQKPDLFISHLAKDHFDIGEIQEWLKYYENQKKFQEKLIFYKRVHARVISKLRTFTTIAIPDAGMIISEGPLSSLYYGLAEWKRLNDKRLLLEQIINVTTRLAYDFDEGTEIFYKRLEKDLANYLDEYDEFLEHHFWIFAPVYYQNVLLNDKIKTLRVCLNVLLKKIYNRTYLDIRRHIRTIIRFLHINSDDDADVYNVVVSVVDSISLLNYSIHHHGKKGNTRTVKLG